MLLTVHQTNAYLAYRAICFSMFGTTDNTNAYRQRLQSSSEGPTRAKIETALPRFQAVALRATWYPMVTEITVSLGQEEIFIAPGNHSQFGARSDQIVAKKIKSVKNTYNLEKYITRFGIGKLNSSVKYSGSSFN